VAWLALPAEAAAPGREVVVAVVVGELAGAAGAAPARTARHGVRWARLLAALVLLTGLASCGAGAGGAGSPPGSCPARAGAPLAASPAGAAPPAGEPLIRGGAVVAVICQYALSPSPKSARLLPRIVLRGAAAAGLAVVLDDARPVSSPPRCAGFPYGQLIVFGYRAGPAVTAGVRFGACSSGVVTVGSRSAVFGSPLQDGLFFYTSLGRHDRGPVTPDVIGLSAAGAATAARRHGFALQVDGAALDDAVPLETVVFQSLPPGAIDPGPGTQLDVFLAVPHAPACTASQLALGYRGGGAGAGNDFGLIIFRDVGAAPCRLAGLVRVTGLDAAGRPVTNTATSVFADPGVLSPHAPPVPANAAPAPGELAYGWTLAAAYRDGPAGIDHGYCQPLWVIPAAWRIVLPGGTTLVVLNADSRNRGVAPSGGLITCQGRLGTAARPSYMTP
jgi:Protein of unknown function (DUF4232)